MNPSGWRKEPHKFGNYSHERLYGAVPSKVEFKTLNRDTSSIPVVYQGTSWNCVAATVTWIKQFIDKEKTGEATALSHEYLAAASDTAADGATPSQVLDAAVDYHFGICESEKWLSSNKQISVELEMNGKQHGIAGYAYLERLTPEAIYSAMAREPIMVGVDSYQGSEPHMMAAYEHEERNGIKGAKTKNWWDEKEQGEGWIPYTDIKFAASILTEKPTRNVTIPVTTVLKSKWSFLSASKKAIISILTFLSAVFGGSALNNPSVPLPPNEEQVSREDVEVIAERKASQVAKSVVEGVEQRFGSAGVFNKYSPTVSESGVDSDDTYLPISTLALSDNSGVTISTSTIRLPAYFIVNPNGTNRETFECNSISSAQPRFTNCYRAIQCNNLTNTTSTVTGGAYAHSAGEPVIMSNDNCFYNRFVDVFTDQNIGLVKTFTATSVRIGDNTTSTSKQLIFRVGQTNNPYFKVTGPEAGRTTSTIYFSVDGSSDLQLNASGTTVGVSSTNALTLVEGRIGWVPSGTRGLGFGSDGSAIIRASSTCSDNGGCLQFVTTTNALGELFWDALSFLSRPWTWLAAQIFQGAVTMNGAVTINGNATTTGTFTVNTPTSTRDAANKGYVDTATSSLNYVSKLSIITTAVTSTAAAETTLMSVSIPANTLGTSNGVRARLFISAASNDGGNGNWIIRVKYDDSTMISKTFVDLDGTLEGWIDVVLMANGSTTAQRASLISRLFVDALADGTAGNEAATVGTGGAAENSATTLNLIVTAETTAANASTLFVMDNAVVEVLK